MYSFRFILSDGKPLDIAETLSPPPPSERRRSLSPATGVRTIRPPQNGVAADRGGRDRSAARALQQGSCRADILLGFVAEREDDGGGLVVFSSKYPFLSVRL